MLPFKPRIGKTTLTRPLPPQQPASINTIMNEKHPGNTTGGRILRHQKKFYAT